MSGKSGALVTAGPIRSRSPMPTPSAPSIRSTGCFGTFARKRRSRSSACWWNSAPASRRTPSLPSRPFPNLNRIPRRWSFPKRRSLRLGMTIRFAVRPRNRWNASASRSPGNTPSVNDSRSARPIWKRIGSASRGRSRASPPNGRASMRTFSRSRMSFGASSMPSPRPPWMNRLSPPSPSPKRPSRRPFRPIRRAPTSCTRF